MENLNLSKVKRIALNFKTVSGFKEYAPKAYQIAVDAGWIDKVCKHMKKPKIDKPTIHKLKENILTYEYVKNEASKYKTKTDFINKSYSAYQKACKMKWLDGICIHMTPQRAKKGLFNTLKACKEEASKYEYKKEFIKNSPTAYQNALKRGWLDKVCKKLKKTNQWDLDSCKKEALKYTKKVDFLNKSRSAYDFALRYNIINEVCSHMDGQNKPRGYWTYENCKEEAKKYVTRTEFSKNSSRAYFKSWKKGWLNEFFID
jgi:hypothetical protein